MEDSENMSGESCCCCISTILILGVIILPIYLLRRYIRGPMYKGKCRIDGKSVVITGGNTGIGKLTAMDLAQRGGKVTILCRDLTRAKAAVDDIKSESGCDVAYMQCDLASFESIRKCAEDLKKKEPKIHILINNAGVMMCPQLETKDGFEMQFGTNHLGHFLLTNLLLDNVKAAAPSRIVNVSSLGHTFTNMQWDDLNFKRNYSPIFAYAQSKLANILFTRGLTKRLKGTDVNTYSLHPGSIKTELDRHVSERFGSAFRILAKILYPMFKTPLLGAQTSIYCAVDENLIYDTGLYYSDCHIQEPTREAKSLRNAEKLWKISLEMVGLPAEPEEAKDKDV